MLSRRLLAAITATLLLGAVVAIDAVAPRTVSAAPGSFTVDDGSDQVDVAIDGQCRTATDTCTLRAAVQEANAAGGTTQILVAPSVETVKLNIAGVGGTEVGDLNIDAGVTVQLIGNVLDSSRVVEVNASAMADRHFQVADKARLELVHVLLAGGAADGDGGAILNDGWVLISNTADSSASWVAASGNTATGAGGAIANSPTATLEIRNVSTSPSNTRIDVSRNDAGTIGGAVANRGGTVNLVGSSSPVSHDVYLDDNTAVVDGGGIHNSNAGSVLLGCRAYTRFSSAERGGDVYNEQGTVTIDGGGVDGGSATNGGGVHNAIEGLVQVVAGGCQDAQIGRSTAREAGGGLYNVGKVSVDTGAVLAISGAGSGGDAVDGGGIHQFSGTLDVAGSIVMSGLFATNGGGGLDVAGGTVSTSGDGIIEVRDSGASTAGGGIHVDGGSLAGRVLLERNLSNIGGGLAVTGKGAVKLDRSAMIDNGAAFGSAAIVTGKEATLDVRNSTAARNSSPVNGGAFVVADGGSLTLRHVTAADNSPSAVWSEGQLSLQRVLFARNASQNCGGLAVSAGDFNVFDDASCVPTGTDLTDTDRFDEVSNRLDGDLFDSDPWSYELRTGHPAIDFVDDKGCGDPSDDQVGAPRPADGDGDGSVDCDSGAREVETSEERAPVSGTVYDEATVAPLSGACVFLLNTGEDDDLSGIAQTDQDGRYSADMLPGEYLVAFFVPENRASEDGCDGEQLDLAYQPEWYRNVPVEFSDADDSDSDVVLPDPDEVTFVEVEGAPVTGIDACLGAGPGAGSDAPCADEDPSALGDDVPRPPASTAPVTDPAAAAAAATPRSLAFTGVDMVIGTLSLALLAAGIAFVIAGRRRETGAG